MSGKLNEFTQYQTAQAIRDAANNPNGGAGIAGMGVGFGAGMAMSQAMNQSAYQQPQQQAQPQQAQPQFVQGPAQQQGAAFGA